jgi:Protein of unknown function (DUF3617)
MHAAWKLAAALSGLAAATLVHAAGTDELWNMNTRMEMEGMQLPARTQQVCMKKGETQAEGLGQQDGNCKVTDQHRSGNKFTWKMVCTGAEAMTGNGEMTRNRDTLEGRLLMKGKDGEMKIAYAGKLSGTCDAKTHQDPQMAATQKQVAAMQAQGAAQTDQVCRESIAKYATTMFEMQNSPCASHKGEYCAHVKKTAQSMHSPAGYRSAMQKEGMARGGWEQAAKYCAVQTTPALAAACKSAVGGRDWSFVADYCPAEAKKIAAEHCAGRDYTAAMASEYKDVCRRYASRGAAASSDSAKPSAAPSASDAVKDGARALKGLFGR